MGNLFGGGNKKASTTAAPKPGSAVDETPRPMPDPESPLARRAATEERSRISRRSGRVSTDLTMRQRRNEESRSALGSV